MIDFLTWLLTEEQGELVPQSVLQSYEFEFRRALERLIQRTQDAALRQKFEAMLDCPIRDARGVCHSFAEYILSALVRNGIHRRFDIEAALSYVFQQMMMDRSITTGQPRVTLFAGFDPSQPSGPGDNPLVGRFLTFLKFAIRNIAKNKIPRLANQVTRAQGVISLGQGRLKDADLGVGPAPDDLPARPSTDADMAEMVADITGLLQKKEAASGLPLTALFNAILAGHRTDQQVQQFGDRPTRLMRSIIKDTLQEYGQSSGNYRLLYLLSQFEGFRSNQPMPSRRQPVAQPVSTPVSPKERDYHSIAAVVAKFTRPVGTADLGHYRRRWLDYPPRDPTSSYRNRLEEVLAQMVQDRVLKATQTTSGAVAYSPGDHFAAYAQQ